MGVNPQIQLSKAISDQDALQSAIADLQGRMDAAILAESAEDISGLRLEIAKLKASLGQARNEEDFWKNEVVANQDIRKRQGELGKG